METRVQYTRTSDGVNLAYTVFGEGPPLIVPPLPIASHLQLEWGVSSRRAWYERLAQRARVLRYDCRGVGMSQRDRVDFSPEAAERDLAAVIDAAGFEDATLFVTHAHRAPAVQVATTLPKHIRRVVVWVRQRGDWSDFNRQRREIDALREENWELYTQIRARLHTGWDHPDGAPFAAMLRSSHTPDSLRAADQLFFTEGYRPEMSPSVTSLPAMILHPLGDVASSEVAGTLAVNWPSAQVLAIPGPMVGPFPNEIGVAAIHEFIASGGASRDTAPVVDFDMGTSVKTILFTDMEDSTPLTERLGDARSRDVLREYERVTRDALQSHGGSEVKAMGDGFMASFGSPQKAVECAVALQRAFASRDVCGEQLRVRAGINAGEPIAEEDDLFGSCVIVASRTAARAHGGEIIVTDVVRQLASGKGFTFADRGEVALKGFEEPVRLFEVRWQDGARA